MRCVVQTKASRARDSMQLTVVAKRDGEWRAEALMNACRLTLEDQDFLEVLTCSRPRLSAKCVISPQL
jgi:hypothetical protein